MAAASDSLFTATNGSGPRMILVHGFTQTHQCWAGIDRAIAANFEVTRVDAPGHGRSGHNHANLWEAADLVAAACGPGIYAGYSMGGRIALHLALTRPETVRGLVLIGAHPGVEDNAASAERARLDEQRAERVEAIGTQAFVDEWLALSMFAAIPPDNRCRPARLTNSPEGLAASLRNAGTGNQDSLWPRLHEISVPVLLVAGANDDKFRRLNERAADAIGTNANTNVVPDAGHACHLESPEEVASLLTDFAASVDQPPT